MLDRQSDRIDVSIVLLTYNKQYELSLVLAALCGQDYPMDRVEIIVVDDGSERRGEGPGNDNAATVAHFGDRLRIRYFPFNHTGNRGRNRKFGADECRGDRMLFLDGDMIPDSKAVGRHMEITAAGRRMVSLGMRWKLLEFERRMVAPEPGAFMLDLLRQYPAFSDERIWLWTKGDAAQLSGCPWIQVYSNNLCLWRDTFRAVGGFDPDFGENWGVEDIELGYRLHREGCTIVCSRDICFYHIHHAENLREKFRQLERNL